MSGEGERKHMAFNFDKKNLSLFEVMLLVEF